MKQKLLFLNATDSNYMRGDADADLAQGTALPHALSKGWAIKGVFPAGADATTGPDGKLVRTAPAYVLLERE